MVSKWVITYSKMGYILGYNPLILTFDPNFLGHPSKQLDSFFWNLVGHPGKAIVLR